MVKSADPMRISGFRSGGRLLLSAMSIVVCENGKEGRRRETKIRKRGKRKRERRSGQVHLGGRIATGCKDESRVCEHSYVTWHFMLDGCLHKWSSRTSVKGSGLKKKKRERRERQVVHLSSSGNDDA